MDLSILDQKWDNIKRLVDPDPFGRRTQHVLVLSLFAELLQKSLNVKVDGETYLRRKGLSRFERGVSFRMKFINDL